jgi:hypothetical protein
MQYIIKLSSFFSQKQKLSSFSPLKLFPFPNSTALFPPNPHHHHSILLTHSLFTFFVVKSSSRAVFSHHNPATICVFLDFSTIFVFFEFTPFIKFVLISSSVLRSYFVSLHPFNFLWLLNLMVIE